MPLLRGTRYSVISAGKWLPTRISGLQLWLKADAGLWQDSVGGTPAVADSDVVGAWQDFSGNSNHAAQATTSKKPLLKTGIVNGRDVVRFDGTDDWLMGAFGSGLTQPFTVIIVTRLATAAVNDNAYYSVLDGDDLTNRMNIYKTIVPSPDVWSIYAGAGLADGAANDSWNIWSTLANGASSEYWINSVSKAAGDAGAQNPDGVTVGADAGGVGSWWDGDVAEILIYDPSLSTANRTALENYLNDRYAIY